MITVAVLLLGYILGLISKEKVSKFFKSIMIPQKFMIEGIYVKSWTESKSVPTSGDMDHFYFGFGYPTIQWLMMDIDYILLRDDDNTEIILKVSSGLLNKIKSQIKYDPKIIVASQKYQWEEELEVTKVL